MNWIIQRVLKAVGWQKLLSMTWGAIYNELEKLAKGTETEFDDKALDIVDEIVKGLIKA